jgi:hypothetical protein
MPIRGVSSTPYSNTKKPLMAATKMLIQVEATAIFFTSVGRRPCSNQEVRAVTAKNNGDAIVNRERKY